MRPRRSPYFRFFSAEYLLDPTLRKRDIRLLYIDLKALMSRGIPRGYLCELPGWIETDDETPSGNARETPSVTQSVTRYRPLHDPVTERFKGVSSSVTLISLATFPGLDMEYLLLHTGLSEKAFKDGLQLLLERQFFSLTVNGIVFDPDIIGFKSSSSRDRVRRFRERKKHTGNAAGNATGNGQETQSETGVTPSVTQGVSPGVTNSPHYHYHNIEAEPPLPPLEGGAPSPIAPPRRGEPSEDSPKKQSIRQNDQQILAMIEAGRKKGGQP